MSVLSPNLIRQVDQYLDKKQNQEMFSTLGNQLFRVFGYDTRTKRISTQVRNLQQAVCSARRFADIEFFVKNQMGRSGGNQWRQVGKEVLKQLETLRQAANRIAPSDEELLAVRLRLARGWMQAVVGQYLYQVAQDQM